MKPPGEVHLVSEEAPSHESGYRRQHISEPDRYEVSLRIAEPPVSALSPAQIDVLDHVFRDFGAKGRWKLVDFVHTLPEWEDPHGSSIPIALRDILLAGGMDEEAAEAVEQELLAEDALAELIG